MNRTSTAEQQVPSSQNVQQPVHEGIPEKAVSEQATRAFNVRDLVDFVATLALLVVLVRAFGVEGYIISTGSMAPHLLGYHKRVVCPSCGEVFAVGVRQGENPPTRAVCPNCGEYRIDISKVPVNTGDQLLVHKQAFEFCQPRRWNVVVFRNPEKPTQAYVKRLVGLPGETIRIKNGDVYINGSIARKNLKQQEATRILVYDADHAPAPAADWRPRWTMQKGWRRQNGTFSFNASLVEADSAEEIDFHETASNRFYWLAYRHWIRTGGQHQTTTLIRPWPPDLPARLPELPELQTLELVPKEEILRCRGVLTPQAERELLTLSKAVHWKQAVRRLAEASHVAPVTDQYAYDQGFARSESNLVQDLMLDCWLQPLHGSGRLVFRMLDGRHVYDCIFDLKHNTLRLFLDGRNKVIRQSELPELVRQQPFEFELSTFDRQILAAINKREVFCVPINEASLTSGSTASNVVYKNLRFALSRPVYIGAQKVNVVLQHLRLYRDIFYTSAGTVRATEADYKLGPDEYFFLGDNSPVSLDSRCWSDPIVHRNMFFGKPLVLHLPSKPLAVRLGKRVVYIRIPDFSRIGYIR